MSWMTRWTGLALVALLVVGAGGLGAARADGDGPGAKDAGGRLDVLEEAFEVLKVRMEARLEAANLLRELGRTDEALEAYREIDQIYAQGMARIEALIAQLALEAPSDAPRAAPPMAIGVGPGGAGRAFRGRGAPAARLGAGRNVGESVLDGLRWLKAHQAPNGAWEAGGFHRWCDGKRVDQGPDGPGKDLYTPGTTGLALLAFLGAGHTPQGRGEFAAAVENGLGYLASIQDEEGCIGPRTSQHFIYNHGVAALAVVEAYGLTKSRALLPVAQKALDYIALARNPYFAWRYGVRPGDNDTSVTGWMISALRSAQLVNQAAVSAGKKPPLVIDENAFEGARSWIEKMTDPDYGRVGYIQRGGSPARPQELIDRFPGEKSEAMTAVGILVRIMTGEDPRKSAVIKKGAELISKLPPVWNPADGSIDMYYWYYGTLAMFQVGGRAWKRWNEAIKTSILPNQRKDTTYCMYKGSWDPIGPWGPDGGRVYSTALMTLCLEVYGRYDRAFGSR